MAVETVDKALDTSLKAIKENEENTEDGLHNNGATKPYKGDRLHCDRAMKPENVGGLCPWWRSHEASNWGGTPWSHKASAKAGTPQWRSHIVSD